MFFKANGIVDSSTPWPGLNVCFEDSLEWCYKSESLVHHLTISKEDITVKLVGRY